MRVDGDLVIHAAHEDAIAHPRHGHRRWVEAIRRTQGDPPYLHPSVKHDEKCEVEKLVLLVEIKRKRKTLSRRVLAEMPSKQTS